MSDKCVENKTKVSVVVPVYNVEAYLEECIDSILKQKLKDIEILLVDDGSTDSSGDICDRYAEQYSNIRVIHKNNKGLGSARNVGFLHASGKYIYFIDSDDWLESDALYFLYNEAEKRQLDIIMFSAEPFSEEAEIIFNPIEYQKTICLNQKMSGKELFEKLYCAHEYSGSIPLRFYRKDFLVEYGFQFPEGIIHEDELYGFLSLVKATNAECIGQQFYKRRFRKGSIMTAKKAYDSAMGYEYTWRGLMSFLETAEDVDQTLYLMFTHDFFRIILNLYFSSFSTLEKKMFKINRWKMLKLMDPNYKKKYRTDTFFLINPFMYKQYRRTLKILRRLARK